ncbi:unnamed protein product [Ectocarpus fasciculatus]
MPELWKPLLALLLATLTSLAGTVSIRIAADTQVVAPAILGSSLWSLSGAAFVYASSKGIELGIASALMSAGGILAINLVGMIWWGESSTDPRKIIALTFIVVAIVLLAWSSVKS